MQTLRFDNRFLRELPGDAETGTRRRQVHGAVWSPVDPTPVAAPVLVAHSPEVAEALGISPEDIASPGFAEAFAGNTTLPGSVRYATNYGGHQFGNWAGQLGDGRAIALGEVLDPAGRRWELQLKGAGPTPYSRGADGRAVLRSSIREFLCSEAMHHLGVPTTRALSLVATGDMVVRDMFYDGNPAPEPGAIVCRVAPSFTRFGHFELPASRHDEGLLKQLVDFTIRRDFPELVPANGTLGEAERSAWFKLVCTRTAVMIGHWMRVGFVHGVMNTDNMSIVGLTIDYGPYGWIDDFDPFWTPNTTDLPGRRYRFGQQGEIGLWNLDRLASALVPAFADQEVLRDGLEAYLATFAASDQSNIAAKLGLAHFEEADVTLTQDLYKLLHDAEVDMTLFFRGLGAVEPATLGTDPLEPAFYDPAKRQQHDGELRAWLSRWGARVTADGADPAIRRASMDRANPKYVLRNWLAQQAIDQAEQGSYDEVRTLLAVMRHPYDEQPGREAYAQRRPDWARNRAGCSALSCSS